MQEQAIKDYADFRRMCNDYEVQIIETENAVTFKFPVIEMDNYYNTDSVVRSNVALKVHRFSEFHKLIKMRFWEMQKSMGGLLFPEWRESKNVVNG